MVKETTAVDVKKAAAGSVALDVVAGIDLGNGYVKSGITIGGADQVTRVYPSVATKKYDTYFDPTLTKEEARPFMDDIINQMDVGFVSPLVKETVRRLFAQGALTSGQPVEQFDVHSPIGKAVVDLSGSLVMGTIAAEVLSYAFKANGNTLPKETIKANVKLATALPIEEYKQHHKAYKKAYLNNGASHMVSFFNFEQPISVELTFTDVHIANEGEAAQYGLMFAKPEFLEVIKKSALKRYPNGELDGATGLDFVQASNTLGIDIGEGTIDFAVFTDGYFNGNASSTLHQGYGNVLEKTLDVLQRGGAAYNSRKQLSELLHAEKTFFNRDRIMKIEEVNAGQIEQFSNIVADEVSKVFRRVGGFVDVIFVYGGGASPLENALFHKLIDRVDEFKMSDVLPIVYLDSSYSRFLNVQGLTELAKRM